MSIGNVITIMIIARVKPSLPLEGIDETTFTFKYFG
jgi:hypothetical protein